MTLIFTLVATDDSEFITPFVPGRAPLPIDSSHPNFEQIKALCLASASGEDVDPEQVADLLDVAATVERKFARLSERVTADANGVYLDGDLVHGTLQDQILDFLDAGEDFEPLVRFYEKLAQNPIPSVRETLYGWLAGQTADGSKVTITEDGDLVGYKGVHPAEAKGVRGVDGYVPSRANTSPTLVNDVPVAQGAWTVQTVGDVVEMPRANVSEPSRECGVGLHIGTWNYAKTFGPVCLKVRFNPRDVVSAPDGNSSWKVRVIRYTVLDVATDDTSGASTEGVVYRDVNPDNGEDDGLDVAFEQTDEGSLKVGDRVVDEDGDEGVVVTEADEDGDVEVKYDDPQYGTQYAQEATTRRTYSGRTSQAAKGRGRNPAQDALGRFSGGRPGSSRDGKTGRFA